MNFKIEIVEFALPTKVHIMISDKLQKKLRPFLDEKLKVKARLLALTSALGKSTSVRISS